MDAYYGSAWMQLNDAERQRAIARRPLLDKIRRDSAEAERCKAEVERLKAEIQRLKKIERVNARLPLGPLEDPIAEDPVKVERRDHMIIAGGQGYTKSEQWKSAMWLAKKIRKGTLIYQEGRDPKMKMRRRYEHLARPMQLDEEEELRKIVQPGCVLLSLANIGIPQTIRFGREWSKDPDGKKVYDRPDKLPMRRFEQWLAQEVRRTYAYWESDADPIFDDPNLRMGSQRRDKGENPSPYLDSFIDESLTMTSTQDPLDPLDALIAAVNFTETRDKGAQIIKTATPKQQEFLQVLRQIIRDKPSIKPRQARLEAYQKLGISPAAGRNLLYRIRK